MSTRLELAAPPGQLHPAEAERLLAGLEAGVRTLSAPLRVWHGPRPEPTGRPRATWLDGAALPVFGETGGLLRLLADPAGPALPLPVREAPRALELPGPAAGRLLALAGWPARVHLDWLAALAAEPAVLATVTFVDPLPGGLATRLLRRRVGALAAAELLARRAGRLAGPDLERALAGARSLQRRVAAGATALVRVKVFAALRAAPGELDEACAAAAAALAASAPGARLATPAFEQRPGWAGLLGPPGVAGRPAGGRWRCVDARVAALCVPLPSPPFRAGPDEPTVGEEPATGAPVRLDRFSLANPARLLVGASGSGKSYAAKVEVCRWLARGGSALVIDPEGEFRALAGPRGASPAGALIIAGGVDPVAVAAAPGLPGDAATAVLATAVAALVGRPLDPVDLALLDAAAGRLRAAGSAGRPTLRVLGAVLSRLGERAPFRGSDLPARLAAVSDSPLARHLAGRRRLAAPLPLVVCDTGGVPEGLRPAVTASLLGWAWQRAAAYDEGAPRLVVVDEGHLLLDDLHVAALLATFARRARKYGVALDVLTQRLSDLSESAAGRVVLDQAGTRLLFGVAEPERSAVCAALHLSVGDAAVLAAARPGRALLCCERGRVPVQVTATAAEHRLAAAGPRGRLC